MGFCKISLKYTNIQLHFTFFLSLKNLEVRRGNQKFPELLKKNYLKYLYKFEALVTFKVLCLWVDAVIPVQLPLLETLSKIFNGNAAKGRQRFLLKFCNVSKMPPFQILIHPWEQKVTRSEVGWVGGWDITHQFVFSQKGGILLTLQRFSENCWQPSTAFLFKILDNVSSSRSGAGIIALEVSEVPNLYEYFK